TALRRATAVRDRRRGAMGILLVKAMPGVELGRPTEDDPALVGWLMERKALLEQTWARVLADMDAGDAMPPRERPVSAELRGRVRCPDCRGVLDGHGTGLRCAGCGAAFRSEYGVPILYPNLYSDTRRANGKVMRLIADICNGLRPLVA